MATSVFGLVEGVMVTRSAPRMRHLQPERRQLGSAADTLKTDCLCVRV